jgi:hypothetical protein
MKLRFSKASAVLLGALSSVLVWLLTFAASAVATPFVSRDLPVPPNPSNAGGWVALGTGVAFACVFATSVLLSERRAARGQRAATAQILPLTARHEPEERHKAA